MNRKSDKEIRYRFNEIQSPFDFEESKENTEYVEFMQEILEGIPFVKNLVSPNRKRAKDLERKKFEYAVTDDAGNITGGIREEYKIDPDITNPHILEDMNFFREAAIHFEKHGRYTNLTPNRHPKSAYTNFWREEKRRCLEGLVRDYDGEWIPGYYYWYLNYSRISKVVSTQNKDGGTQSRGNRVESFPEVWDADYLYFHYLEKAESVGLFGVILKTRRRGYSFKGGSNPARNFTLIPKSNNFLLAYDRAYLEGDGIWAKAMDNLDWVAKHTPFPRLRYVNKQSDLVIKGGYKKIGSDAIYGSKALLDGIITANNEDKARGIAGKYAAFEEAGKYPKLLDVWGIAESSFKQGNTTFGFMVAFGTGGSEEANFQALENLFRHPSTYSILGLPNVYDFNVSTDDKVGFFSPEYLNRGGAYDENGNSDVIKALSLIYEDRLAKKYNSNDPFAIVREKAERPCVVGNTLISNNSIGSDKIINYDNKFINGIQPVYRFNLKSKRSIDCTLDHEIFDGVNYKAAKDYNIGDKVKLKPLIPNKRYQKVNIKGDFKFDDFDLVINKDWGRFIGLYMGDGTFYKDTMAISFDSQDKESIEWFINFAKKYFKEPCIKHPKGSKMVDVLIHSTSLKNLFKQLDLIRKTKSNKTGHKRKIHVPHYIFKSPKSVIGEFLKGYFDADSGIYKNLKNIKIYSKHLSMLQQVQYLLTAFDIYSNIKSEVKINGEGREYNGTSMVLRSWEVDRFKKGIGYISGRKQKLLNKWTTYVSKTPVDYDYDIFENKEYLGEQPVYDIQTEEGCYSANGIWVHNCTPTEAMMRKTGTMFPVHLLTQYLSDIKSNESKFVSGNYIVDLDLVDGKVKWRYNKDISPIRTYPHDPNVKHGAVELFQLPEYEKDGSINPERYILAADTYDDDMSTTNSLGCVFVFDLFTDTLVAEYTGRPTFASDFYEICRRLCILYNGKLNYENNKKGLYGHFRNKNSLFYLETIPEYLLQKNILKGTGGGNTSYGTPATAAVNMEGLRLQAEYLEKESSIPIIKEDEDGNLVPTFEQNYKTVKSIGYIEEAVKWNPDNNFDRVSAMNMLMISRANRQLRIDQVMNSKIKRKSDDPFFRKIFRESGTYSFKAIDS